MTDYASTATWPEVAMRIRGAVRVLITSHTKPDGDAMGSSLALARALGGMGKEVVVVLSGPMDRGLREVAGPTPIRMINGVFEGDTADLILVVDTGSWSQLESMESYLKTNREKVIGIDHHARGDDVAPMRVVQTQCASTTQVLVGLLDQLGVAIEGGIAEAIFVGLATDTGWFKFSNADHQVYSLAARLLKCGVNKERLYALLEENDRPERIRIEARVLGSTRLLSGDSIAVMRATLADFAETGARPEDLTGIVNEPMSVATVRMSVLFTEHEPGVTKISFRSKPGGWDSTVKSYDVNEIAGHVGGGGHVQAAGARIKVPIDEAERRVLAAIGL